jgi:ABC-type multidrug transport system ATPase subunit
VLAVEGVSKAFGERLLVDGMSFDVPPGEEATAEHSVH